MGGFDVTAQAPESLAGVRVGDLTLPMPAGMVMPFAHRASLPVRWQRGAAEDRIAIVFEGNGSMVCGARDEGAFDLDGPAYDRAREIVGNGGIPPFGRGAHGRDTAPCVVCPDRLDLAHGLRSPLLPSAMM